MSRTSSQIGERLSDRDWQVLVTVRAFKYLTTRQLARQHFGVTGPICAIPRHANHSLGRLRELGLLVNLERRIGGVRSGSSGHIWQITDLGSRFLSARFHEPTRRVRPFEPGATFLEHTLSVAEVVITIKEGAANGSFALERFELEPDSWRTYLAPGGATRTLKPDLTATTTSTEFEDIWLFEIDRDTESPGRVVTKCLQYQEYRHTGTEQKELGIFPAVVWVVPNVKRRDQLRQRLEVEESVDDSLFTVVTPSELGELLRQGAETFRQVRASRESRR